jgi:exodeoxyribonuclease V alpha subunit
MLTAPTLEELQSILSDPELFSSLDRHFAMFIGRLAKNHSLSASLAAALVSRNTGAGNICLDLAEYAGKPLLLNSRETDRDAYVCPNLTDWTEILIQSKVVGQDEGDTPLVLDKSNRLYLRRYWQYEKVILRFIQKRAIPFLQDLNIPKLRKDLKNSFKRNPLGRLTGSRLQPSLLLPDHSASSAVAREPERPLL